MRRVVVAITGASGAAIGVRVVERLAATAIEVHLVLSEAAHRTLIHEVGPTASQHLQDLVTQVHPIDDIGASIASGSFASAGMIVAPCSMHTLAAIANGLADNLIVRAADVHLKERLPLVLMTRETPLHLGHLRNMVAATEMGGIVMPPVPAFYNHPASINDVVDQLAAKAIDLLRLWTGLLVPEWSGTER